MTKRLCTIYRSSRIDEMYLYVDLREDLAHVPEPLLAQFGRPQLVMKLALGAGRPLARIDVEKVLAGIDEKGFYLQMPPPREDYLLDLHRDRADSEGPHGG